jgi:ATP-dependent DNA ligase
VFRDGDEVELGSRNERPLTRYFPEVVEAAKQSLPDQCVVDGEVIVAIDGQLQFERLLERIHPAESRVRRLAEETPASFVAFDLLAIGDDSLLETPQGDRRRRLEEALALAKPPMYLTRATADLTLRSGSRRPGGRARRVVAKPMRSTYQPGVRTMLKVKHERTADVVVAGYRLHKTST